MLSAYHIEPHSVYSIWKNTFFPFPCTLAAQAAREGQQMQPLPLPPPDSQHLCCAALEQIASAPL